MVLVHGNVEAERALWDHLELNLLLLHVQDCETVCVLDYELLAVKALDIATVALGDQYGVRLDGDQVALVFIHVKLGDIAELMLVCRGKDSVNPFLILAKTSKPSCLAWDFISQTQLRLLWYLQPRDYVLVWLLVHTVNSALLVIHAECLFMRGWPRNYGWVLVL